MKGYTDLEQSRKLMEILPIESADKYWMHGKLENVKQQLTPKIIGNEWDEPLWDFDIPCWSLAALLDVIPDFHLKKYVYNDGTKVYYVTSLGTGQANTKYYDNPVDACYDIILKLYKLKKL